MTRGTPTFTERMRRQQLVEVTIRQLADRGYARTSLADIARGAGISKAAVLYHFQTKEAVVAAAYQTVLDELVAVVGAAVDAVDPAGQPAAYVRSMIEHLAGRPDHASVLIEALTHRVSTPDAEQRWAPVAALLQSARAARGRDELTDARTAGLALGGMIDSVLAEKLRDPAYDTVRATGTVSAWLDLLLDAP